MYMPDLLRCIYSLILLLFVDSNGRITALGGYYENSGPYLLICNIGGISCHVTFTGTYSVNANGTGTASLNATPDAASLAKGCQGGASALSLAIANGGTSVILASQSATGTSLVTAAKQ